MTGIPEKIFIDRDGFIARKFVGPMNAVDLRAALDELLAEEPTPGGESCHPVARVTAGFKLRGLHSQHWGLVLQIAVRIFRSP